MSAGRRIFVAIFLFAFVTAAVAQSAKKSATAKKADAGTALHELFDAEWEYGLQQDPVFASTLGDRRWNDRLPDASLKNVEADHVHTLGTLKRLAAIDRGALTAADQ